MWRIAFLALVMLSGCSPERTPQEQATNAADAYMQANGFARSDGPKRRVTVQDDGKYWAVTYHVPDGYAGGDIIIFVDKLNMKVVNHVGWQ